MQGAVVSCDGDAPTSYRVETREAGRDRVCCECSGRIATGQQHEFATGLWDGEWHTFRTCADCLPIRCEVMRIDSECDGFTHGGLVEAINGLDDVYERRRMRAAFNASVEQRGGKSIHYGTTGDES